MKDYELRFTQDVIYSVTVVVKATNNVEAIAKAIGSVVWEKQVCNFADYKPIHETGMMLQEVDGQGHFDWDGDCPVFTDWEIEEAWHDWAEAYLANVAPAAQGGTD